MMTALLGGATVYITDNSTLAAAAPSPAGPDEHLIRCSICGRSLIVKDTVNNGMAFLSHLKIDHGITYFALQMSEAKAAAKKSGSAGQQQAAPRAPEE